MDISQKIQKLYEQTGISPEVHDFGEKIEKSLKERFDKIDKMAELNQLKVIHAMQEARVNAECFNYASGYGYNDFGRDTLEKVYANVFHTEDALVYYDVQEPKGECVMVIEGKSREEIRNEEKARWEEMSIEEHMELYLGQGMDKKSAMKQVAKDRGVGKRDIYQALL